MGVISAAYLASALADMLPALPGFIYTRLIYQQQLYAWWVLSVPKIEIIRTGREKRKSENVSDCAYSGAPHLHAPSSANLCIRPCRTVCSLCCVLERQQADEGWRMLCCVWSVLRSRVINFPDYRTHWDADYISGPCVSEGLSSPNTMNWCRYEYWINFLSFIMWYLLIFVSWLSFKSCHFQLWHILIEFYFLIIN